MFHVEQPVGWGGPTVFCSAKCQRENAVKCPCFPQIHPQVGIAPFPHAKQLKNKAKNSIFVLVFPDYAARPPGFP
jgi:hypothetical protein